MKRILVTGSSKGLGLEFVKQYLETGNLVIASSRNPDKSPELEKLKNKYSENLITIKLDVSKQEDREKAFEQVSQQIRGLDLLINNAGIISGDEKNPSVFGAVYKEDLSKVFLVNSISPLVMSETFLPLLEKGSNAKIINITSMNGSIAKRESGGKYSYAASKAALNMITKIMSYDLKEKGIITLAIHPGWIKTDMGGEDAPLEKEEPISLIIDLIEKIDISNTGKFLDWQGNELPW